MPPSRRSNYDPAADMLRIIAILAVVFIHTTTRTLETVNFDLRVVPWTLFINQAARFAAPLFFLISGFVLEISHSGHISYLDFFRRRLNKIFIPFVFWSAVYYYFVYRQHTIGFLQALYNGSASYQLYFIPALMIFYLIFPLLHRYLSRLSGKLTLMVLVIIQIVLLAYDYYIRPLPFYYPAGVASLNFFVFLSGMLAARYKPQMMSLLSRWKYILIFSVVALALLIFWQGENFYGRTHNYLYFYTQWRPSVLFYTAAVAGLLYYLFSRISLPRRLIGFLSTASFFVFFIHVLILEVTWSVVVMPLLRATGYHLDYSIWFDPLYFLLVAGISFVVAYLVRRIPVLARITG